MLRAIVTAVALAGAPFVALAQAARALDPADPKADARARAVYESAFKGYRPHADAEVVRWRESNDEMGRLKGHVGHVPESASSTGTAPASKSGHPGHAGRK